MSDVTLQQVFHLADQLSEDEQIALVQRYQTKLKLKSSTPVAREELIAKLETRRAEGAFENVEDLSKKYARPDLDLSDEELNETIRRLSNEWARDLDELDG